jgi:UDP:flavonoid glycosyltransferase YjiC (YdhE family)
MQSPHVAIVVEPEPGHINPTLGIASSLIEQGYRVSYAATQDLASRIEAVGARALIYSPLNYRAVFPPSVENTGILDVFRLKARWQEFVKQEMESSLPQLEALYADDRPDLVVYDCRNLAGKALAARWGIPKIEHSPLAIGGDDKFILDHRYDEDLVICSIPIWLQRYPEMLDSRFHFIDPIYKYRMSTPYTGGRGFPKTILVSQTTSGQPAADFYRTVIAALKDSGCHVVLSIGERLDPESLGELPANFEINTRIPHLNILEHSCLFIGDAGFGSFLEALSSGVPVLAVIPAIPGTPTMFDSVALRITELGLGSRLFRAELSIESLRRSVQALLEDAAMLDRVKKIKFDMRRSNSAEKVVSLVSGVLNSRRPPL